MEKKVVSFTERLFSTMIAVILVLVLAGILFHFAVNKGLFPSFFQKVGSLTNLQAQAGA